jgi:ABC-type nickel/cobalt efflux system permease component RcnA
MFEGTLQALIDIQSVINQRIAEDLRVFAADRSLGGLLILLPIGAAFGAVHALTPGHSKTVLASYVAGSAASPLRAVGVATVLSITHILSAVLIAVLALPLVTRTLAGVGRAPLLEDISRGLLALIGVWMIVRAIRAPAHRHAQGVLVGIFAGLIPCPLTLFTMVLALRRGIPEAGFAFAFAMMVGVAFTLSVVAALTAFARETMARALAAHAGRLQLAGRWLEAAAGVVLVLFGLHEIFRR